ncbi:MAG: HAMP domain-containing sensor histidine kinase, partial [Emcibacteraceae bacterium]|nr:HAMP domain-containing sensor histidine kinase [Emcibacteraceae bacterium]
SSRHLLNLVNDILDLSEIESGKKNMDIKHISLRDVLDDCQFIITKLAEDKQISCAFNIPKNMTLIFADDRALKQIFINIMNNSVKFTENGGKISLNAQTDENSHIIIIEDNGQGIPEDKMETVLNPFSRVENDPYRTQEGKGLGLAIVKSLMSLHNGTIEIESEYGIGTKVILTFPNKVMN